MDRLWSPWRYAYVSEAGPAQGCIFCEKAAEERDESNYIVHRGRKSFVLLNLYPYTLEEMMMLGRAAERNLRTIYQPRGFNIGMNIGECAGAGVAGHIHMHVVPRWPADSNFMTTVGETRVLPEAIEATYRKLLQAFTGPAR